MAVCEFGDRLAYFTLRPDRLGSLCHERHLNGFAVDEPASLSMQTFEKPRFQGVEAVFMAAVIRMGLLGSHYHHFLIPPARAIIIGTLRKSGPMTEIAPADRTVSRAQAHLDHWKLWLTMSSLAEKPYARQRS